MNLLENSENEKMKASNKKKLNKEVFRELLTIPVPSSFDGIKGNITINTNVDFETLREKIIHKAFKFHSQGNIIKAAKYYKQFIDKGFTDFIVFSNYGVILKDLNNFEEAEIFLRKAIEINPDFAEGHSNLGNTLRDLGKLVEAEVCLRKAIEINPDFAEAHGNLGNTLRDLGKLEEAEILFRKAIELAPDFVNAYLNLGQTMKDRGKTQEALDCYQNVITINPKFPNIYSLITRLIRDSNPSHFNKSNLRKILKLLLDRNDISHIELFSAFKYLYANKLIEYFGKTFNYSIEKQYLDIVVKDEIIINSLKKIIFNDPELEKIFTILRKNLCYYISNNIKSINSSIVVFIIALAEQCFFNEYVYSYLPDEILEVNKLIKRCENRDFNEIYISIIACYIPLYKLIEKIPSLKSFSSTIKSFNELLILQIVEPLKEIEYSTQIKKLGSINDPTSLKVKTQYEENPYPRWRYGDPKKNQEVSIIQSINSVIKPNSISQFISKDKLNVLIAGCGTGQHILHRQNYRNSKVIGIDLSLSSLAYAQRKIFEFDIDNVELIQMDILEVNLLKQNFDVIESSGVLHHMEDPIEGLKSLISVLKNDGFLRLGLYSELARQDICNARNYIKKENIMPNENNIRNFREKVFAGNCSDFNTLKETIDFYSLSQCRDLCFHEKEHRFTINQLKEILNFYNLDFLGFILPYKIKSLYKKCFPKDINQTNLENWNNLEEKYPKIFREMYQFWVAKAK